MADLPIGNNTPFAAPLTTTPSFQGKTPPGLTQYGNIDLQSRPIVNNPDGSYSSVRSMSFQDGKNQVLVPTVSDGGRIMSNQEAIQQYRVTGQHLGKFATPDTADAYAETLHNDYATGKITGYPSVTNTPLEGWDLDAIHRGVSRGYDPPVAVRQRYTTAAEKSR